MGGPAGRQAQPAYPRRGSGHRVPMHPVRYRARGHMPPYNPFKFPTGFSLWISLSYIDICVPHLPAGLPGCRVPFALPLLLYLYLSPLLLSFYKYQRNRPTFKLKLDNLFEVFLKGSFK